MSASAGREVCDAADGDVGGGADADGGDAVGPAVCGGGAGGAASGAADAGGGVAVGPVACGGGAGGAASGAAGALAVGADGGDGDDDSGGGAMGCRLSPRSQYARPAANKRPTNNASHPVFLTTQCLLLLPLASA